MRIKYNKWSRRWLFVNADNVRLSGHINVRDDAWLSVEACNIRSGKMNISFKGDEEKIFLRFNFSIEKEKKIF